MTSPATSDTARPRAAAIIPAAGFGTRMQLDHPKQYHELAGAPVLVHTIRAFLANPGITQVIVVVPQDHLEQTREMCVQFRLNSKPVRLVPGGARRQDSVRAGLQATADEDIEIVLVHDGARPLVSQEVIDRCYRGAVEHGAVIAAVPVRDTLKQGDRNGRIRATIDRSQVFQAQTPQAARRELLERAFALNGNRDVTDEASLLENASIPVTMVAGSVVNMKITHPEDLILAEKLLPEQTERIDAGRAPIAPIAPSFRSAPQSDQELRPTLRPAIRIGHGYDAHQLVTDRKLVLGGIEIPHSHGLAGHSDADVLTHALCDAILGALGAGDIGRHFPDNDDRFKNIYSIRLLEDVIALVEDKGYVLGNADITVVCQAPKLAPHLPAMRELIAGVCQVAPDVINIKATTTEKMGFTGRKEGIACHSVVLLTAR